MVVEKKGPFCLFFLIIRKTGLKSENKMKLNELLSLAVIDSNAKNYAKEFGYTSNHISYFYNNLYQIILYKESKCIEELFFNLPIIGNLSCDIIS